MTPAPVALAARRSRAADGAPLRSFAFTSLLLAAIASAAEPTPEPTPPPSPPASAAAPVPLPVREAREISVTAERGERNVLDVPANVSVIDRAAIERSGAANVPELLRREAGLFVTNTTTNLEGYSVEARGFQNGGGNGCRTLVLVDGRRANEADTGCPDWTFIPLADVERVEVVRGPGSAAYGDNAIGGVIQIFTRGGAEETRASLGVGGGSYDTERADVSGRTHFGALGVGLSAGYDDTAGFRDRSDYDGKRGKLDVSYEFGDVARVDLSGGYASTERSRPGALFAPYATRDGEEAGPDLDAAHERERFVQATVALALPAEISLRAVPYYRRSRSIGDTIFGFQTPFPFAFHYEDEQDSEGLDLQLSRDFALRARPLRLLTGAELRQDDDDATSTFAANSARRRIWALFAQGELTLADDWLLSAGVRYDESNLEGTLSTPFSECGNSTHCDFEDREWSPRVALTWRFAEPGALYASYAEGFRFPNLNEAFGAFGFAPSLRPERSKGFELGAKWSAEKLRANAAFYQTRVRDEIFFNPLVPNPLGPFPGINENVDEVRHRGVELNASYQALEWLELYAAYTFDDVEVREDALVGFAGEQLPLTPKSRGSVGVRAALPLGLEASLHASYVGERRLVNDVAPPSDFLPSYASYDARVAWSRELAPGLRLLLEATGRNLSNRHYAEWGGWNGSFTAVGYFPSPERNFAAGARLTFQRCGARASPGPSPRRSPRRRPPRRGTSRRPRALRARARSISSRRRRARRRDSSRSARACRPRCCIRPRRASAGSRA